jgi:hypothetical protein
VTAVLVEQLEEIALARQQLAEQHVDLPEGRHARQAPVKRLSRAAV